jgi:hypothetical protein
MALPVAPTRQELLHALWLPAVMAPFLFVYVRYRMLTWDVSAANRRDGVDYSPEAWRLSGYVSVLFVLVAYPVMLAEYVEWFWKVHPQLALAFIAFWISLCGWVGVRHSQLQSLSNEKLLKDLEAISHGLPQIPPIAPSRWLQVWGLGNGVAFAVLLFGVMNLLSSLR